MNPGYEKAPPVFLYCPNDNINPTGDFDLFETLYGQHPPG